MHNPAFIDDHNNVVATKLPELKPKTQYTFDEAITLTEIGKFHYILLWVCGFVFMVVMLESTVISIILPSMKCDLAATSAELGFVGSAGFLGIVLSSHAMGFLADTMGRVKTLRYALALSAVVSFISAFSVNVWMMIVFRFLTGLFISGGQACVFSLCGEFHGNKTRVRHITLVSTFLPTALSILPALAVAILPIRIDGQIFGIAFSSWRLLIVVNISLTLIALLGLLWLPETPKYVFVHGNHDETLRILRLIYVTNTGKPAHYYPVETLTKESTAANLNSVHGVMEAVKLVWNQTVPLFYKERVWHTINICVMMFVIYFICQGLFMWFPTILDELLNKNGNDMTLCQILDSLNTVGDGSSDICQGHIDLVMYEVMILIGVIMIGVYLVFTFAVGYVSRKKILVGWFCGTCAFVLAIHWVSSLALAITVLTGIMSVGNCGGIVSSISTEYFPTNINAMAMCFMMMIGRLGAVIGANVFGEVLFSSCDLVFWVLLFVTAALVVMSLLLPERKKERSPAVCP